MLKAGKRIASELSPSATYDQDYWAWTTAQAGALRARRLQDLDLPHLAEEIADLGKSEERRLESELARLLEHLLKLGHASDQRRIDDSRGWLISIKNARRKVRKVLGENPGLKTRLE